MWSPTSNTADQRGAANRFVTLCLLLVWFAGLGLATVNRQHIIDWWRLRQYVAPAAVSQLASDDTMTGYARNVFYINYPAVNDKVTFRNSCPNNGGERTIVLGCYHGNQGGIFLLAVSDPRLEGVQQVTAAHEMLHAAYDRLSSTERTKVNALLQQYYTHEVRDQRVRDTIEAYKQSEPDDLVNEMHSVFGSEVANLPAELEHYYQRYFTNRARVAAFADQYQAAFISLKTQSNQLAAQITQLKQQIEAHKTNLHNMEREISTQHELLLSKRNNGDIAGYDAGVDDYNNLVEAYQAEIQHTNALIDSCNDLITQQSSVNDEQQQLVDELNSSKTAPIER